MPSKRYRIDLQANLTLFEFYFECNPISLTLKLTIIGVQKVKIVKYSQIMNNLSQTNKVTEVTLQESQSSNLGF